MVFSNFSFKSEFFSMDVLSTSLDSNWENVEKKEADAIDFGLAMYSQVEYIVS